MDTRCVTVEYLFIGPDEEVRSNVMPRDRPFLPFRPGVGNFVAVYFVIREESSVVRLSGSVSLLVDRGFIPRA